MGRLTDLLVKPRRDGRLTRKEGEEPSYAERRGGRKRRRQHRKCVPQATGPAMALPRRPWNMLNEGDY